ncbi:MAG: hypothetical protein FWG55_00930 [Candidatus Bathyarchaeota archaeon]|nr:hypothetical protein [Candidatus Termiticorpusculum sp.]
MSLLELLILLSTIPSFLFLTNVIPPTQGLLILLWVFCLAFDMHSTYEFYIKEPDNFTENERNKLFSSLTKKFGFKKAATIFPLAIEIPLLLFLSTLTLPILQTYMFPNTPTNIAACITTSLGIAAIGHLQAAIKNTHYTAKHQTPNSVDNSRYSHVNG